MNIVFCYWKSICEPGMTRAFKNLGHNVIVFDQPISNKDTDKIYLEKFIHFLRNTPDVSFVFSVNFIPIIAKVCKALHIHYLSFTVDSPALTLYSASLGSPYSHAFLFDRTLYNQFYKRWPKNVHYLPLGSDLAFYDEIVVSERDHKKYGCDISFIGSFHSVNCEYDKISQFLPDYIKGYANGLIAAQMNVYGYYFINDSFSDEWAEEFKKYADWKLVEDYEEDVRELISDFYIGFKLTQQERIKTLNTISEHFKLDLYTTENPKLVPKANFRGISDSKTMMPKIFKCSKINLNMSARTIKSGLPLRIFDIMGVGGFVISNYQSEIPEYFVPGEDIVMYDSMNDLLEKINYYLTHEEERLQIAKNGYEKIKRFHSYESRLSEIVTVYEAQIKDS